MARRTFNMVGALAGVLGAAALANCSSNGDTDHHAASVSSGAGASRTVSSTTAGSGSSSSGAGGAGRTSAGGSGGAGGMTAGSGGASSSAGAGGGTQPQPVPGQPITDITVTVTSQSAGSIGESFCGISLNKQSERDPLYTSLGGNMHDPNYATLVNVFKLLGQGQGPAGGPGGLLRIGGTDVDDNIWTPDGPGQTAGQISKADIDALAQFAKDTNWDVLYGVDFLGNGHPNMTPAQVAALAAEEVQYAATALGSHFYGVEIGNEPDVAAGYKNDNNVDGGIQDGASFYDLWVVFAQAIQKAVPGVMLTGPALGSGDKYHIDTWTQPFVSAALDAGQKLDLITQHWYPGFGESEPDGGPPFATLADLFSSETTSGKDYVAMQQLCALLQPLASSSKTPFRIDETNSFIGRPPPLPAGLDNGEGSALWMIDHLFTIALGGAAGVNIISGPGNEETSYGTFDWSGDYSGILVTYTDTDAGTKKLTPTIQPEFYGMLLFSMAGQGALLSTTTAAGMLNVSSYAVQGAGGGLNVVINNKDGTQNLSFTLDVSQALQTVHSADLTLMTAPSLTAVQETTIQGAQVSPKDGSFTPELPYALSVSGAKISGYVNAASAALIRIR